MVSLKTYLGLTFRGAEMVWKKFYYKISKMKENLCESWPNKYENLWKTSLVFQIIAVMPSK